MRTELSRSCPCCAGKELLEIGKLPDSLWFAGSRLEQPIPGGWLFLCRTCGLKFRNPANTDADYSRLYDNAVTATWSAETDRTDWDLIARYISEMLPQGGKVLDFGCYTGGLLARLGPQYQRYGVEVNRVAADIASQSIGRNVWSSIDDVSGELRFDVVIAADVVEHLRNPLSLVRQLTSKLSDSGVLIMTTGDADNYLWNRFGANWWYCFYPEHITFVSRDWLRYVSEVTGIGVVHCETFRYARLSRARQVSDLLQTYFYGVFPTLYLSLARLLRKMLGRPDTTSIPGAGLSRDHLFIVLKRAVRN